MGPTAPDWVLRFGLHNAHVQSVQHKVHLIVTLNINMMVVTRSLTKKRESKFVLPSTAAELQILATSGRTARSHCTATKAVNQSLGARAPPVKFLGLRGVGAALAIPCTFLCFRHCVRWSTVSSAAQSNRSCRSADQSWYPYVGLC
jgi:hypothetical protein